MTSTREGRPVASATVVKVLTLVAAVAVVSLLHYLTAARESLWHAVYQHLYHVPVIFGAYWFGVRGGVATATVAALAYLPHIEGFQDHDRLFAFSQYTSLLLLYIIGTTVGLLASSQRRVTARYREAAESLQTANRQLTQSQEEVRRADRLAALGQIAAGLAHELRNPLAAIKGSLEILRGRAQEGTPEAEFTALAEVELSRLDTLLTDFLAYARPREPQFTASPLDDVIEHVVALLRPTADRGRVKLEMEQPRTPRLVRADREQIGQVMFNVVVNAIQATPEGGTVRVTQREADGSLAIDVIDQGPGIPPEKAGEVFEPFFTTRSRGTGLGLPIAQRIVVAHHGRIELTGADGGGTRCSVILPLLTGPPAGPARTGS